MFLFVDILVKSAELLSIWKFDIIPDFDDLRNENMYQNLKLT